MIELVHRFGVMTISALIVVILGAQSVASFCQCTGRWQWPMLSYDMYATARSDGDRVHHDYELYAVLHDGQRLRLSREDLGISSPTDLLGRMRSFFLLQKNVVYSISRGKREKVLEIVERVCSRELRPTRLEVYDLGVAISRNGAVHDLAPELVGAVDVACS